MTCSAIIFGIADNRYFCLQTFGAGFFTTETQKTLKVQWFCVAGSYVAGTPEISPVPVLAVTKSVIPSLLKSPADTRLGFPSTSMCIGLRRLVPPRRSIKAFQREEGYCYENAGGYEKRFPKKPLNRSTHRVWKYVPYRRYSSQK